MRYRNVAYALLLVLAVAVAAGAVFLWASSRPPREGSAEAGFARDMMVHHAQAVEMAEIVRDKTEDEKCKGPGHRHRPDPAGPDRADAGVARRVGTAAHRHRASRWPGWDTPPRGGCPAWRRQKK